MATKKKPPSTILLNTLKHMCAAQNKTAKQFLAENGNPTIVRICSKCNLEKPATTDNFYFTRPGLFYGHCISCHYIHSLKNRHKYSKSIRAYAVANKEHILKIKREWYHKNKETIFKYKHRSLEYRRKLYARNKVANSDSYLKSLQRGRDYNTNNKDKIRKQKRKYCRANREAINRKNREKYHKKKLERRKN